MNTKSIAVSGIALALGLAIASGTSAQAPGSPPLPSGPQVRRMGKERHPEMMAALRALRNARERLRKADRDFGGHRAKAEEHTEAAIREVEQALAYDRR